MANSKDSLNRIIAEKMASWWCSQSPEWYESNAREILDIIREHTAEQPGDVERVAKAIWAVEWNERDTVTPDQFIEEARAAIAAMGTTQVQSGTELNAKPGICAKMAIDRLLGEGSSKDGSGSDWKSKGHMYHLVKGMAHLAMHIKQKYDARAEDGENHLHRALSRLAMALIIEEEQNSSGK